ncbi:MAG: VanZ family protein [Anaerolineae bacterium]|jgi:hypothetical protein|nr:VanZ family protein [Anaerolineae bacterium]MBT7069908.1 VanZ family protein [Anaerolineae bacterium]MBT7323861.1 VanZ family protein [Anaerolineae bacterium]
MPLITSKRERNLWLWALALTAAIYVTLGLAGKLAQFLRDRNMLDSIYVFGFFLAVIAIIGSGLKLRLKQREIWVALGVVAVYGMVSVRLFLSPEERTHLFEYGIVATLVHQALLERLRNGRRIPSPALLAIAITALIGWFDEGIQFLLPNRIYDIRDVGFNALAGLMAVLASVILSTARNWITKKKS